MFITPKFVRSMVADSTGRRQQGMMVRIWASAIFYGVLGLVLGFAACAFMPEAKAHGGSVDDLGCHEVRATGEVHCHVRVKIVMPPPEIEEVIRFVRECP